MVQPNEERVVFVNPDGTPTGETGRKLDSHTADTRLHLAFSCYVFNDQGKFLITRRADTKKVWPGVWTNSVCGHPAPRPTRHTRGTAGEAERTTGVLGVKPDFSRRSSLHRTGSTAHSGAQEEIGFDAQARDSWEVEPMADAIVRRLDYELGMTATGIKLLIPDYIYTTTPYNGIIEHEFCPIYIARAASEPIPNPDEVGGYEWLSWGEFTAAAENDTADVYSWWCKDQLKYIKTHPLILEYARPV